MYAAVSALAEAVHVQAVFAGFEIPARMQLRLDSKAARAILLRTGPGAVRHRAVRVLWAQAIFRTRGAATQWVSGDANPADLGTKALAADRFRRLRVLHDILEFEGPAPEIAAVQVDSPWDHISPLERRAPTLHVTQR